MKSDYPSWLYSVGKGATTMWEHWDGIKPDGSFWSETMNSFNHYAYGAIGEWMMRALAGIDLAEPAYGRLMLHPRPIEELDCVSAWQETPYGRFECGWRTEGTECAVDCRVPAGTTAALILEHASADGIGGAEGIASVRQEGANTVLELGSGSYAFRWTRK